MKYSVIIIFGVLLAMLNCNDNKPINIKNDEDYKKAVERQKNEPLMGLDKNKVIQHYRI